MAWPSSALACVLLAYAAAALPAQPAAAADTLEGVKTAVRLKNFSQASEMLQRIAAKGDPEAQYLLGVFYLNGVAGPRNPAAAREWFEKAATQGNARAAFSLATLLAGADPPDPQASAHWLQRAHELGFSPGAGPASAAGVSTNAAPASLLQAAQLTDPAARREGLWLAATTADVASLEILADPANVQARDEYGRDALDRAAEAGSAAAVTLLIRRGAHVDAPDQHGVTALMLAAGAGDGATVDALINAHANLAATDRDGNTALMHAAAAARLAAAERLLGAGAAVAPRNVQDWSALDFAEVSNAAELSARLREKGATALHRSAISTASAPSTVQRASRDLYAGWPDLAVAAGRDNATLLQTLLSAGADANGSTPDGDAGADRRNARRQPGSGRNLARSRRTAGCVPITAAARRCSMPCSSGARTRSQPCLRTAPRQTGDARIRSHRCSLQSRADMRGSRGCCSRRMRMSTHATRGAGAR